MRWNEDEPVCVGMVVDNSFYTMLILEEVRSSDPRWRGPAVRATSPHSSDWLVLDLRRAGRPLLVSEDWVRWSTTKML